VEEFMEKGRTEVFHKDYKGLIAPHLRSPLGAEYHIVDMESAARSITNHYNAVWSAARIDSSWVGECEIIRIARAAPSDHIPLAESLVLPDIVLDFLHMGAAAGDNDGRIGAWVRWVKLARESARNLVPQDIEAVWLFFIVKRTRFTA
jgi:hypothetical protein